MGMKLLPLATNISDVKRPGAEFSLPIFTILVAEPQYNSDFNV